MSTGIVDLGFGDLTAPMGSHIGYRYQDESERYNHLLRFMASGLRSGEKCIAAISEYTLDCWIDGLRSEGVNLDDIPGNQFQAITAAHYSRKSVAESVQTAIHLLGDELTSAMRDGWRNVRVCSSFMHLYHHQQATSDLLAAECEMNEVLGSLNATVICTFSTSFLHPDVVQTMLKCHPLVTDGTSLAPNDDHVPPCELAGELPEILRGLGATGAFSPPCAVLDFHSDGTPVIHTCAELDFYTSPRLEELANLVAGLRHKNLVIDLSATTYLDASTIGVIVRAARAMKDGGGRLTLYDPKDPMRKIFRLVHLDEHIPIYRSLESAIANGTLSAAA